MKLNVFRRRLMSQLYLFSRTINPIRNFATHLDPADVWE
jgi:hypothetical protein